MNDKKDMDKRSEEGLTDKKEKDKKEDDRRKDDKRKTYKRAENKRAEHERIENKRTENKRAEHKRDTDKEVNCRLADCIQETASVYKTGEQRGFTIKDYYALPEERRVELIDGVFYDMAAPTIAHQLTGSKISRYLEDYIEREKGSCICMMSPVDVQLDRDDDTMVQPDVLVVCDRDKLLNRCIYGAPDFIVEVLSPATRRKDSMIKLAKYRAAGVREYWMVDMDKKKAVVYEFEKEDSPVIYGMDQEVSVGIFEGRCMVDLREVYEKVRFLIEKIDR